MKKNVLGALVAIFTCCLFLTSCGENGGSPADLLLGNWFMNQENEVDGEKENTYALLSFGEDGVFTQCVYWIYPNEPANYSERIRRHSIYTINETAGTITFDNGIDVQTVRYQRTSNNLTISSQDGSITTVLHRPSDGELEKARTYDQFISSDDYIGRWFYTNTFGDLTLHGMLHFDEDGKLEQVTYTVYGENDCTRKNSTLLYNEYQDKYQVLEIHDPKDYSVSTLYEWAIVNDHLKLENTKDEDNVLDCHPLCPADIELMAKLDKLVK